MQQIRASEANEKSTQQLARAFCIALMPSATEQAAAGKPSLFNAILAFLRPPSIVATLPANHAL